MKILRYDDIDWALPFLFGFDVDLIAIVNTLRKLNVNFKINAFGTPKSKWSGGRLSAVTVNRNSFIKNLLQYIVSIGVRPSLTFSNHHIGKEDLDDPFCNYILDVANELDCNLIISSDLLFKYVKDKYPSMYCTASVIKPIFEFQAPEKQPNYNAEEELNYYNKLSKKYDKVVVRPEFSKFYLNEYYRKIKDISKIEVLLNQTCEINCPYCTKHYAFFEQKENDKLGKEKHFSCFLKSQPLEKKIAPKLYFDIPETDNLVNNIGIKHLKLQGRAGSQGNLLPFMALYYYMFNLDNATLPFQLEVENEKAKAQQFYKQLLMQK